MLFQKSNKLPSIETFKLGSRYYYARLCPNDRKYYRAIYDQWLTGGTEARLVMPGTEFKTPDGTTFHDLVLAVVEDNPHLFHVEISHFQYFRKGSDVIIRSNNIYTPQQFRENYERLRERVAQILAAARKYKTKWEQVRFLHDYLAASITYDWCTENEQTAREAHTMVGALLNRRCVCDGYARALRLLCDRLGISCIVVIGEGPTDQDDCGGHAWNIVKLDQVPYHVDATWDSNITSGRLVKQAELLTGDASAARRHRWDRDKYPRCPKDWPRWEPLVSTVSELDAQMERQLKAQRKLFLFRVGGSFREKDAFNAQVWPIVSKYRHYLPHGYEPYYYFNDKYGFVEFELRRTE